MLCVCKIITVDSSQDGPIYQRSWHTLHHGPSAAFHLPIYLHRYGRRKHQGKSLLFAKFLAPLHSMSEARSSHLKDGAIHFLQATCSRNNIVWDFVQRFFFPDITLNIVNQSSRNNLGQTVSS